MKRTPSLRVRLTLIILLPLLLIALGVGYWAYVSAEERAQTRFDRSLLSTALAISRDVALSGGDALSPTTRDLISDTSGGPVFYHVYAPDGVFVTGYATPPVIDGVNRDTETQTYYEAVYLGAPVRVLRLRDATQIDGLSGDVTLTVWQATDVRDALVRDLVTQNFIVMATLIASVALIVWFGVGFGLRPLSDLENAISQRSSDDLSPIQRPVPNEVKGITATLNSLLGQVSETMETKNAFISNAAHQLRNPLAGILAMAEAVRSAPNEEKANERSALLVEAAEQARDLANQMLTLERANSAIGDDSFRPVNLSELITEVTNEFNGREPDIAIMFEKSANNVVVPGDTLMIREAISNLIDNACVHGGVQLSQISISLKRLSEFAHLTVKDNGVGMSTEHVATALERFGQLDQSKGSGLGLPIAAAVARQHGGTLDIDVTPPGMTVSLKFKLENHL